MPELRWILLIVGVLFIVALAVWERRQSRRSAAGKPRVEKPPQAPRDPGTMTAPGARAQREPSLTLPDIRVRDPAHDLSAVDAEDDSSIGLRIDGRRIEEEGPEEPMAPEPIVPDPQPATRAAAPPIAAPEPPEEPIVDWPPEGARRIIALRLVSPPAERFFGRTLRQALAAEGFLLGKFSIFHKPGPDKRAILSAASLTKPGTFDLDTMDGQRFVGLSLFIVLPGPLPDAEAFDALVAAARGLSERLGGALQDGRGEPLTAERIAGLRAELEPAYAAGEDPSEPPA